jgi:hypothetical protein
MLGINAGVILVYNKGTKIYGPVCADYWTDDNVSYYKT